MSSISYSRTGSGDPVVLIHGIGHRREAWGEVPSRLAKRFDVIALDLPGFGMSPPPQSPDTYAMSSCVEQLERFFGELGLDRPHVVGNSLGGIMALELAARGSVSTATALSPAGFYLPHHLAWVGSNLLLMKLSTYAPRPVLRKFASDVRLRRISMRSLYVHPEHLSAETAYGDTLNLRTSPGFWPHFFRGITLRFTKALKVPTTIGWGEYDRMLLPSQGRRARRRLPDITHVSLANCGHCPQIDDPALVTSVIEHAIAQGLGGHTRAHHVA